MRNDGAILLDGGRGNLGGEIREDGRVTLLGSTFGEHGPSGEVRLDGRCEGTCAPPATRGAFFHVPVAVSAPPTGRAVLTPGDPAPPVHGRDTLSGVLTRLVNGSAAGGLVDEACFGTNCSSDRVEALFPLAEGMNVLSLRRADLGIEPHPWLRAVVFHFAGIADADGDGLTDGAEAHLGTNATATDTDGDGLDDFAEAIEYRTDPRVPDTDGDGFADGLELARGFDPLDPSSHPSPLPFVVSTAPVAGAASVSLVAPISVTFSEPMDPAATTFEILPPAGLGPPAWSADGRTATLRPDPALAAGTAYTLEVEGLDLEGYALSGLRTFAFTTEAGPVPLVANGAVWSFAAAPDGTVYLGGEFSRIGRRTGGGVPLDAATGAPVEPFAEVAGSVNAVVPDGAGGWWIGGDFRAAGGTRRNHLAHLLPDGRLDAGFDAGFGDLEIVERVAAGGGRVFAWTHGSGARVSGVHAFDGGNGAPLWAVEVGPVGALLAVGGTVYVGGSFVAVGARERTGLAALDAATGAVLEWDPGLDGLVSALAWSGTALHVGGNFTTAAGAARAHLAAFDATGALTAWDPGADGPIDALAADGTNVYLAGPFSSVGGQLRQGLAAVDASGAPTPWNPGEPGMYVGALASDGATVWAGGWFPFAGGEPREGLAAYDLAGDLLPWAPRPIDRPSGLCCGETRALAVAGGVVFAGGAFTGMGGVPRLGLAALDARGELLPFDPSPGPAYAVARAGDRILAIVNGDTRLLAFDRTSGALAWALPVDGGLTALASEGDVARVAGGFQTIGGASRRGLAAVSADGTVTAWNPGADGAANVLAVHDGTVFAGGAFAEVGGQARVGLAAVDAAGAATPWAPELTSGVTSLAVVPGAVYLGGVSWVNGEQVGGLAAVDAAGALLPWSPSVYPGDVRTLATDGATVYVGGIFEGVSGGAATNLGAVDLSGAALPWDHAANGMVLSLLVQGSRLWIGGYFTTVGALPAQGFATVPR